MVKFNLSEGLKKFDELTTIETSESLAMPTGAETTNEMYQEIKKETKDEIDTFYLFSRAKESLHDF